MRATYREAPRRPTRRLEPPPPPPEWPRIGAASSLAVAMASGIALTGQLELAVLAGAGAVAAAMRLAQSRAARRRHAAIEAFLGTEFVEGPSTWTSVDGERRIRAVFGDPCIRFEWLDPSNGQTLRSFRASAEPAPEPLAFELLERTVAPIEGRPRTPRCFDGLPRELGGGSVRARLARTVALEVRRDGVLLVRQDADGAWAGDTWHLDRAAALAQLASEHDAAHVGRFGSAIEAVRPRSRVWDSATEPRIRL